MSDSEDSDWVEMDGGLLTTKDREYLMGELDFSSYSDPQNSEYQRRYQIRKRVEEALVDFAVLLHTMPLDDLDATFEEMHQWGNREATLQPGEEPTPPEIAEAWEWAVQFLLLCGMHHPERLLQTVADSVQGAITVHYLRTANVYQLPEVSWEVDFPQEPVQLEEFAELFDEGGFEDLPPYVGKRIIETIVHAGMLSENEAEALVKSYYGPE